MYPKLITTASDLRRVAVGHVDRTQCRFCDVDMTVVNVLDVECWTGPVEEDCDVG